MVVETERLMTFCWDKGVVVIRRVLKTDVNFESYGLLVLDLALDDFSFPVIVLPNQGTHTPVLIGFVKVDNQRE